MNWKSILATGLITGIVTIVTGIILFWWQGKEPKLTYNFVKSIPFDDGGSKVFIQQFEVLNSGNKIAEDISFIVQFPKSKIQKSSIRIDGAIKHKKEIKDDSITLTVDSLNPSEGLSLSVLLEGQSILLVDPNISLRAKGIIGEKIGISKNESQYAIAIGIALVAAYAGIFAFILSNKKYRKKLPLLINLLLGRTNHNNIQKNNIASLLSMYGFPEKAREYLNYGSSREYWVEADLIAAEAIAADDTTKKKMLQVLFHLVDFHDMASSSKAIVHYNIARIKKSLDDNYEEQLNIAKEMSKDEIATRFKRDPIFND